MSKKVFLAISGPSLFFLSYTTAFMPNLGIGEITNTTNLASLNSTHCLDICNKNESIRNYCSSLWRYSDDQTSFDLNHTSSITDSNFVITYPQTHGVILIVLTCLFILSGIEGILESRFPNFPYRLLYEGTEHISLSKSNRRKSELKDLKIEMNDLKENIATKEQKMLAEKAELVDSNANLKIEMSDLRKNLNAKEDETLATTELLSKENSSLGPKISCVEDPFKVQSKSRQSDLNCSVEAIESQNENFSQQEHQENSLEQGNVFMSIDNKTVRR